MALKTIEQYEYNGSTINKVTESCWVFIHDGTDIILDTISSTGCIQTMDTIFAADTEQECIDEISNLNLNNPFSGTT